MENVDNKFFTKTFFFMFLGLLGTAIVDAYTYYSGLWINLFTSSAIVVVAILELVAVLVFSFLFKKLPPTVAGIVYFLYAFLNGVTFSTIFAMYELDSIVLIFITTSVIFGTLALVGMKTDKDLSKWSTILVTCLIVSIIASVTNIFMNNSMLDIVINWAVIFLFGGITIYDMNKLKQLSQDPELNQEKLYIYGALQLYLDFINIFIRLLRLFAKARD